MHFPGFFINLIYIENFDVYGQKKKNLDKRLSFPQLTSLLKSWFVRTPFELWKIAYTGYFPQEVSLLLTVYVCKHVFVYVDTHINSEHPITGFLGFSLYQW